MQATYCSLEKENGIGILTIHNPPVNAVNVRVMQDFEQCIRAIEADEEIRVVILTGAGRAFIAGGDIDFMHHCTLEEFIRFIDDEAAAVRRMELMPKPVIAAVNGACLGAGCEISLACDFRIASEAAKFGFPEVSLGIIPGCSGTLRLPRLIGLQRAKKLMMTGERISAQQALAYGLVLDVVPQNALLERSKELAGEILRNSPFAVGRAKICANKSLDSDLDTGMALEAASVNLCFAGKDKQEGMLAFMEKRQARY